MRDFNFYGLRLGDPQANIEKCFSDWNWEYVEKFSDPKADIHVYCALTPEGQAAMLFFFKDQLYSVRLGYDPGRTSAIGGWTTILERLVGRFGKAHSESAGVFPINQEGQFAEYFWHFRQIAQSIMLRVYTDSTVVEFTDDNLELAALDKKKREANLGF